MREWSIYILIDPRTLAVRYVGWAYNVEKRVKDHVTKAKNEHNHKASWIVELLGEGLKPDSRIIETGTGSWAEAERRWIAFYRADGADLTNLTDGGEGIGGCKMSAEARQKMRVAKLGKRHTPEQIEKVAVQLRGRKRSVEAVGKYVESRRAGKGWVVSEETRELIRQKITGFRHTDEAKAKISAAGRGRRHSEESKRKNSEAHRGKQLSVAHRKKLSEAKRGRTLTEEHKQHLRESAKHIQRCGICGQHGHKRRTCSLRRIRENQELY